MERKRATQTKAASPSVVETVEKNDTRKMFIKLGGGSLRLPDKLVKPNERFLYDPAEIPERFKDMLQEVSGETETATQAKKVTRQRIVEKEKYSLEPVDGEDLWNVVNSKGKSLNQLPLSKEAAEELLAAVES